MSELRGNVGSHPKQRQRAVLRTLGMADEAAEREDYLDALAWLGTLDAIGYELSPTYEARRDQWRLALSDQAQRDEPRYRLP